MENINLTNTLAGLTAIQRAMAGEDILFTKLEIGDGVLTNTDVSGMTGLVNKTKDYVLGVVKEEDSEIIRLRSNISNAGVTQDLIIREYGIYAKFGNEQEFLFAYLNVGDLTTPLPNQTIGCCELNRDFVLYIGNSLHVDFTSNGHLVYVSVKKFDETIKEINKNISLVDPKGIKKIVFEKGYKKESSYMRIPSITKTTQGTLICGCDLRYNGKTDMPNHIDILLRISDDNGYSFNKEVILSRGSKGITDSALGHDPITGTTYLLCYNNTNFIITTGGNWDFFIYKSVDGGYTWDEGTSLKHLLPEGKEYLLQGPASGIYKNGKMYFAVQSWKNSTCHSHIMHSSDGTNWTISNPVPNLSSECTVFEYEGLICLGTRNEDNTNVTHRGRIAYYTKDDGITWIPFNEIIKTTRCQSSSLSLAKELYLTSYVEGPEGSSFPRTDMYISNNYGSKLKLVDGNTDGYSVMAKDNEYLYVLYERQGDIEFQRFDINLFMQYEYNQDSIEYPLLLNDTMYCTGRYKNIVLKSHPKDMTITKINNFKTVIGTFCLDSDKPITNVLFQSVNNGITIVGAHPSKTYKFNQYPAHLKYYRLNGLTKADFFEFEYPERTEYPVKFTLTDPMQIPTLDITDISSDIYKVIIPGSAPGGIYKIFGWSGFGNHTKHLRFEFKKTTNTTILFKQSSQAREDNIFLFEQDDASITFTFVNGTFENYDISERGRTYAMTSTELPNHIVDGTAWIASNVMYTFKKLNFVKENSITLNPALIKEPIKILNESINFTVNINESKTTALKINKPDEIKPFFLTLQPYSTAAFLPLYQH